MRPTSIVFSLVLAALLLAACGAQKDAGDGGGQAPQGVGVLTLKAQELPITLEASATVTPLQTVDVRAQLTSTVREVRVKEGQFVKKGELLFVLDARADQAALDKARAQAARDRASLSDLQRQLKRTQELRAQGFVAQSAVDSAQAAVDAGAALLRSDEAAVQAAQAQLSYSELRAPISGRAGIVSVYPGSLVQASSSGAALVNIAQLDPVAVTFPVPQVDLGALLNALRAGPLPAQALLDEGTHLAGQVTVVDNTVDAATGTVRVKAQFANAAQRLWPGQSLRVRLTLQTLKNALVVPQSALILERGQYSAYVLGAENKAELVPLQVQRSLGEQAVVSGLKAGQKLVVQGKQNLHPGAAVKVLSDSAEPVAAAAPAASAESAAAATRAGARA